MPKDKIDGKTLCYVCDDVATDLVGDFDVPLCPECARGYEENGDKTGFCSLVCCVTGSCDDSC